MLLACSAIPVIAAESDKAGFMPPTHKEAAIGATQVPDTGDVSEALQQIEREEREHEEWLETPEAEDQRENSQFAFSDLAVEDAKELLKEVFSEQLKVLNGDPSRFLSNAQLVEPLGDSGAVVKDDGEGALLETTVPVRTEDESGQLQKVDLSLEATPEGFETENAVSDLVLPASADEAIQVGGEGFEIAQSGADGTSADPFGDKNLFYPSVLPDTDLLVASTSLGVELFNLLRSKDSPEDLTFDLELPEGAELRPTEFGGAEVVRGEEQLIRIPAPTAVDAQGATVPVEFEVLGSSIFLHVNHHDNESAYPILVDPIVEDWVNQGNNWYSGNNLGGLYYGTGPWHWERINSNIGGASDVEREICCYEGHPGLLINMRAAFYGPEQYGQWIYRTENPNVIIPHVWLIPFNRWDGSCGSTQPHDYVGLWNQSTGWDPKPPWANYAKNFGNLSQDGRGESLVIGMSSGPPGVWPACDRILYVGGAGVWLDDEDLPVLSTAGSTKWMDKSPVRLNVSATDPGVGVKFFEAYATNSSGALQGWTTSRSCTGLYGSRCSQTWDLGNASQPELKYDPSVMPEGIRKLTIKAYDATTKPSTTSNVETVRVDHSAPTITLSGTVTEQAKLGTELETYTLAADAADGVPGGTDDQARSGVVKLAFEENGKYVQTPYEKSCGTQSCKLIQELEVPAYEMSPGSHTVTVKAWDALGHEAKKAITFTTTGDKHAPKLNLSGLPAETLGSSYASYWNSFGSAGYEDGQFKYPTDVAIDLQGNLWVTDKANHRIEKFDSSGNFIAKYGSFGSGNGQLNRPSSVAIDAAGNVFIADSNNHRIQKLSPEGTFISKFGTFGSGNGQLNKPEDVAVDAAGNIWVADTLNGRVQKFNGAGEFVKVFDSGYLYDPTAVDVDVGGNVWVADWRKNRITIFDSEGNFKSNIGTEGQFNRLDGLEIDDHGNVWVADLYNNRIQRFNLAGEYVGQFGTAGSGAGQFGLDFPMGIAADSKGHLWITDFYNDRVQEWLVPNTTVAGPLDPIDVSAADSGFGVTSVSAKLTAANGSTEVLGEKSQSCEEGKCSLALELPEPDLSEKPEGAYILTFSAADSAGNVSKVSKVIGLDPTPPTIDLSGTLAESANEPLNAPNGDLSIKADDPAGSGVREINVERDGRRVASFPYSCAGNCGEVTASYRYSAARDGTERVIQKAQEPAGATLSKLTGVSCRSATNCIAVGHYINSAGTTLPLAQRWDGTEWKAQTPPVPVGALESKLEDVDCVSSTVCVAVGNYKTGTESFATLVERWNGSTWSIQSSPNAAGKAKSYLNGIACATANDCWAVGKAAYKASEELEGKKPSALIERWNGSAWSISSMSEPPSQLTGISCATTSSCVAVSGQQGLAVQRWNGSAWTPANVSTPVGGSNVALVDVSCSAAAECTAVGSYDVAGHTAPLAERWDGSSWSVQITTDPFGVIEEGPAQGSTPTGKLEGVSCPNATSCTAFGSYSDASEVIQPLAESWDGTEWALQPAPAPVESTNSVTSDVSCFSSFECTSAGYAITGSESTIHPLIEGQASSNDSHRITVEAVDKYGATAVKAIDVDVPIETPETPECSQETSTVAPKGTLSATEAANEIESELPEAVAPTVPTTEEATEEEINPSYSPPQPNLEATGNLADGETSVTPDGGVTLAGVACITPSSITTAATQAKVVNSDSAVFANTAPETQTAIRPTSGGVGLVQTINGPDAPDSLSWNVTVPVGMELEKLPSGAIAIVRSLEEDEGEGVADVPEPSGAETPEALNDAGIQAEMAEYQLAHAQEETNHEVIAIIAKPWVVLREEQIEPLLIELAPTEEIPTEYVITVYLPADQADAAFYPIHAHLEATASISGSGRCPGGSPCGQFNAADAAKYAEFWGNPSHPRNQHYHDYGGDNCTNFVSQVIFAGRVRYMRAFEHGDGSWWYFSGPPEHPSNAWDDTESWRLADKLPRHLWRFGLAHIDKQEPWAWTRGTILSLDWHSDGKGNVNHVQFVVGSTDAPGQSREPYIANNSSQGFNYGRKRWLFVKESIGNNSGAGGWSRFALAMKHTAANLNAKKHDPDNLYGPSGLFKG